MFEMSVMNLPYLKMTASGTPAVSQVMTTNNVLALLEHEGMTLRFNIMRHTFELTNDVIGPGPKDQAIVYEALCDGLAQLGINSFERLPAILETAALKNGEYHPMEDWILATEWDGVDRLDDLAASVPTDSKVWPEYLRKWLIQAVEGVRGWRSGIERSIPHVLVFAGGQGAGKGRWLRSLAPGFMMADAELHLSGSKGTDHQLQVLSSPMVELGEIDSTFKKSDISALKAFLSRPIDTLRAPYGRRHVRRPRVTTFAGSVNTIQFVNDSSGARRFWPVQLRSGEELDWDHGIDVRQVWAQANSLWEGREDWNLEDYTLEAREEELAHFVQEAPIVELAAAWHHQYGGDYANYALLNRTQISMLIGGGKHPAELANLNDWLFGFLGPHRRLKGHQRCWAFPIANLNRLILAGIPDAKCITENEAKQYVLEQKPRA